MTTKLKEIVKKAQELASAKQWFRALKIYRLILDVAPYDCQMWLNVSDAIMALGYQKEASVAYKETVIHSARAGYPLISIVAAKKLYQIAPSEASDEKLDEFIASMYGAESEIKGKTVRLAPLELEKEVREDAPLDYDISQEALVKSTLQLLMGIKSRIQHPRLVPPIPILSDLPTPLFKKTIDGVNFLSLPPSTVVLREGEEASTFYMIAKGRVSVYKGESGGRRGHLASLGEGSIFGEMALITNSPRSATVETDEPTELLEFDKSVLQNLSNESEIIEAALERFTKERLILNLLATNPIFQPFDRKQRFELLNRFTAHEVTEGTILVKEGQEGRGLYIILYGEADVTKKEDGKEVLVATLKSGDMFGEISLIRDTPTTATVKAVRHSTILFLPREYFQKLTESIEELKKYFDSLSTERLTKTEKLIEEAKIMEKEDAIKEDELILI